MDTDKVLLVTGGSRGIGAAGVARIFDTVDDVKLPLTGFVNNAGIVGQIAPFTECTRERLQRTSLRAGSGVPRQNRRGLSGADPSNFCG